MTPDRAVPEWGGDLPRPLGDKKTRRHEQVLWKCARMLSAAMPDKQQWLALIGGTALRHVAALRRASLCDLASITGKQCS